MVQMPTSWFALSASERKTIIDDYHANNIAIMLSAFGANGTAPSRCVGNVVDRQTFLRRKQMTL
jgi:hypothetical protein